MLHGGCGSGLGAIEVNGVYVSFKGVCVYA